MSGPWFKCYPRDYNAGMVGLTLEERGAYVTILNLIYDRGGPIPEDAWWITSNLGCTARTWVKVRASLIVKRKLHPVVIDGQPHLMNDRAAEEIQKLLDLRRTLSVSGARGGRNSTAKTNKNEEVDQASLKPASSQAQAYKTIEADTEIVAVPIGTLSPDGDANEKYPPAFETAWKAYPHVRGRSSKPKALGFWRRLSPARREALPAAIDRYARNGREPNDDCGAPAMERWLRDQKFLDWLDPASDQPTVTPLKPRQANVQRPNDRRETRNGIWAEIADEERRSGTGLPARTG